LQTNPSEKPISEVLAYEEEEADCDILAFIEYKYCTVCHLE
jgi:palmitoyltransferase